MLGGCEMATVVVRCSRNGAGLLLLFSRCDGGLWAIMTTGLEIFFLEWDADVVRSDVFSLLFTPSLSR